MDKPETSHKQGTKRCRSDDALANAYKGVKFTAIASTSLPGTPHRYFRESFRVEFLQDDDHQQGDSLSPTQTVHSHVNGLVVVTAGNSITAQTKNHIESIEFLAKEADVASQSAGNKRKQKAKMLRGKSVQDAVFPKDVLATVTCRDGDADAAAKSVPLRCCVWGSVLEVNSNLSPQLLQDDPLLDGYLAVILPSGPFPPKDGTLQESKQSSKAAKLQETKGGEAPDQAPDEAGNPILQFPK